MRCRTLPITTGRVLVLSLLIPLLASALSCAKIEQQEPAEPPTTGELTFEVPSSVDAIPVEYGRLIAVQPHGSYPNWTGLWFEKPDQTLTVVWVDARGGRIHDKVLVIPRK